MAKSKSTPERDRAQQVRDSYAAEVEAVRANTDLTPKARTRKIAELHRATKEQLQRLAEMDRLRLDAQMADIDKTVFSGLRPGWNAGPEAHEGVRAALDRAAAAKTPEDATRLLEQATQFGDHALASAVAQVADRRA